MEEAHEDSRWSRWSFMVSLELTTTPRTLMVATLSAPLINGSEWSKATDKRLLKTISSFVFVALSFRLLSSAHHSGHLHRSERSSHALCASDAGSIKNKSGPLVFNQMIG